MFAGLGHIADTRFETEVPLDFDPDRPTGWTPRWHERATLVPWGPEDPAGARRMAGIFDAEGRFLAEGHCHRYRDARITLAPDRPTEDPDAPFERLEGNWLFGGIFYSHFGHFLCESTSRLWAAPLLDGPDGLDGLAGIVFHPKQRLTHERRQFREQLPFFDALGLSHLAIRAPQQPVVVDRLALPPTGFGIGGLIAGRPEYRAFMRAHLGAGIAADGPADVYVSRSRLNSKRGSVLQETRIETLMAAAGYDIFHPQDHDLATQIARWKAARRIVALDGSALHLAAMLVPSGAEVAILNRGPSENIGDYIEQFRRFAGSEPCRIDAVTGFWRQADTRLVKRETHALLDMEAVGTRLAHAGFIPDDRGWTNPDPTERDAMGKALADRLGTPVTYMAAS